jgi:hypothetical protein
MGFSEELKLNVTRKAHFSCCLCHSIGVEIHHIIPQSEGGLDIEDNAAPLCPSCHETYGANPQKRKFIREVREFWYEICERRFTSDQDRMDRLENFLQQITTKEDLSQAVREVLSQLSNITNNKKYLEAIPQNTNLLRREASLTNTNLSFEESNKLLNALISGIQIIKVNDRLEEIHETLAEAGENFHQTLRVLSETGVLDIDAIYDKVELFFNNVRAPITPLERYIFHLTTQYTYLIKIAASAYHSISFITTIFDEYNKNPDNSVMEILSSTNQVVSEKSLVIKRKK